MSYEDSKGNILYGSAGVGLYRFTSLNRIMKSEQLILQKLGRIEKEVETIKKHMVDVDSIITEEDYKTLLEYREEKKSGKLVSHERVKKELGL